MERVAVVGGGAWGTALAAHAVGRGHEVALWTHEPEVAEEINSRHTNSVYLQGATLPEKLCASAVMPEVLEGATLVILVPPSKFFRAVSEKAAPFVSARAVVVVATKGIEEGSLSLMSEVLAQTMPALEPSRLAVLSGPTFAREVVQGLHAEAVLGSWHMVAAERVQAALHSPMFRLYASDDPVGVQVGGAVKNVIAIAAGICDGLGLGTSARAALITRGLAEIARLGRALGAQPLTFLGLSGVGDLVLTATGELSRNRTLGLELARGVDARRYLAERRSVAEGFTTAAAVYELSQRRHVETPLAE
ncbi:MAG: NAD(P)H-dependent glycerol-3-phosphate dehydrogenase, partial [Myxococcota bacterium]